MTPFHGVISNFEKNYCSIINKIIFLPKFWQLQVFSWKGELREPKGNLIELSTFLKYGLTEVKKAPLQMFDLVLNIPLWT